MAGTQQALDQNYKPIPGSVAGFDPTSTTYIAPQAGPVQTASDGTKYAVLYLGPVDGQKNSYSAAITGLASAASATDIFTITGSSTKTVRITRVEVSGIATTILDTSVRLIVRTTADSGGTSAAVTAVPHDQSSPAATATVLSYTANPTINDGTTRIVRSSKVLFNLAAPTAGSESGRLIEDFGDRPAQAIVLRGTAQQLAINLNGVTVAGPSIDISVEWTEDNS